MNSDSLPQAPNPSNQTAMMELVYEITRRFAGLLDLNQVLAEVLSLTVDTLGADRGSIFLLNREQQVSHRILARRIEDALARR